MLDVVGHASSGIDTPADDLYGFVPKRFDYTAELRGVPVHIGCHARDPHIPLRRVRESEAVLRRQGAACTVDSEPDAVTITTQNSAPVANAGSDQSAFVGNTVTLDGSGNPRPLVAASRHAS